jgi:hypothetical protein
MIYTLDWIKQEALGITGHWNGEDAKYIDASGEVRSEEDAQTAQELLDAVAEVESLMKELGI